MTEPDYNPLVVRIRDWARDLGFQQVGIADAHLGEDEERLLQWLQQGRHGEMQYMHRYGRSRARPSDIVPGTLRVISARMDYLPHGVEQAEAVLADSQVGYVSRYALGRDYHKVMRARLARLAEHIQSEISSTEFRVFVDSGPVMEKAFARNAGLGWIGKHTNLINRRAGSWFFLGEILTNLPLPIDATETQHGGNDGDDQKDDGVMQHDGFLMGEGVPYQAGLQGLTRVHSSTGAAICT